MKNDLCILLNSLYSELEVESDIKTIKEIKQQIRKIEKKLKGLSD